ncbi:MAG TPA: TPM domain-containing protein [Candidatus Cybelea sp.]
MTKADRAEIAHAIAQAEDGTSGRIAVRVIPDRSVDAFERAKREFGALKLHRYEPRNGALILVAPNARQFAIIGDKELHERVGGAFWDDVVKETQPYFASGDTQAGILYAIARIGEALRQNFGEPATS